MEKDNIIELKTAILAKEKGFNYFCYHYYKDNKLVKPYIENGSSTDVEFRVDLEDFLDNHNQAFNNCYSAPTQSLLQKWLREEKDCFITVDVNYGFKLYLNDELHLESHYYHKSYEHALEEALLTSLRVI